MEPFETLRVWHDARSLTQLIYQTTRRPQFRSDRALALQLNRAAISVMSNITEGYERGGDKEFRRFLLIAKGSCGEIRSQLYAAEDLGYLAHDESARLRTHAAAISRKLSSLALRPSPSISAG